MRSSQSGRWGGGRVQANDSDVLPNQLGVEENKALGFGYLVQEDKLFSSTALEGRR